MKEKIEEIIYNDNNNLRIDKFLSAKLKNLSRNRIEKMFNDGLITLNGNVTKKNQKLSKDDLIKITIIDEIKDTKLLKENIKLDIVYEDDYLLVINKPKNMVVHPSVGHSNGTLVNALLGHTDLDFSISNENRPGIVHRIDKDTTGLLVVAKNDKTLTELQKQLQLNKNKREYVAIVHGNLKDKKAKINLPIGRDPKNRQKQAVFRNGKDSVTYYEVLEEFENYSLVKLNLETGRTHQIRVHMSYIGHPIAGDQDYGFKNTIGSNGQLLHAISLGFQHPIYKSEMEFRTDFPSDFKHHLSELR